MTQSCPSHVGASEANRRAMPPDECRSEGTPSLSEGPYIGASLLGYLFAGPAHRRLKKVTRRKGETASGRYRRNGYVHLQNLQRQPNSLREQARSHRFNSCASATPPNLQNINSPKAPPNKTERLHPVPPHPEKTPRQSTHPPSDYSPQRRKNPPAHSR